MIKIYVAALVIAGGLLTGCYGDPQSTKTEGNGFQVEFLFQHDGIKVYRFRDGGHMHYFTNDGETISTITDGKSYYEETIK